MEQNEQCRKTNITSQFSNRDDGKTASYMRWKKEFGVVRIPKKQESVFSVSEVVSFFTTTQALQMRGGADTDEKMGHERDASPNPRAMCCNFRLSAHCQVFWHQLLGMWKRCGRLGAAKRNQEVQKKLANHEIVVRKSSELMLTAAHHFFLQNRKSLWNELIKFLQLKAPQKTAALVTPRSFFLL